MTTNRNTTTQSTNSTLTDISLALLESKTAKSTKQPQSKSDDILDIVANEKSTLLERIKQVDELLSKDFSMLINGKLYEKIESLILSFKIELQHKLKNTPIYKVVTLWKLYDEKNYINGFHKVLNYHHEKYAQEQCETLSSVLICRAYPTTTQPSTSQKSLTTQQKEQPITWVNEDKQGIAFTIKKIPVDGECAITSLNIGNRASVTATLLYAKGKNIDRVAKLIAPEIMSSFIGGQLMSVLKSDQYNLGTCTALYEKFKKQEVIDEQIEKFCKNKNVINSYIQYFVGAKGTWLSYDTDATTSMDAIAQVHDLLLLIFKEESGQLKLMRHYIPEDCRSPKIAALLHTQDDVNNKYHFDRLNVDSKNSKMILDHFGIKSLDQSLFSSSNIFLNNSQSNSNERKEHQNKNTDNTSLDITIKPFT